MYWICRVHSARISFHCARITTRFIRAFGLNEFIPLELQYLNFLPFMAGFLQLSPITFRALRQPNIYICSMRRRLFISLMVFLALPLAHSPMTYDRPLVCSVIIRTLPIPNQFIGKGVFISFFQELFALLVV